MVTVNDSHTGWTCDTGASLISEANRPGKGRLPDHGGAIYVCPDHQGDAEARIIAAGWEPDTREAPPGHRWDPWPCGHITTYVTELAASLAAPAAHEDPALPPQLQDALKRMGKRGKVVGLTTPAPAEDAWDTLPGVTDTYPSTSVDADEPPEDPTTFTAAELVRHVARLADAVGRQGVTELADELAAAAKLLQYRYDAPAWQGRNGTKPDSGIPAVDLMRRVRWEGNGFLAVSAGEIRRTYDTDVVPLERNLAGHNLLTLPRELPADDDARVLLYTGLSQIAHVLTATEEDRAAVTEDLIEAVRRSRLPHPHPMDF